MSVRPDAAERLAVQAREKAKGLRSFAAEIRAEWSPGTHFPATQYEESAEILDALAAELSRVAERERALAATVQAVNDNALAWHAGEDGKANALNVIAVWTSEALAGRIHPSVAKITDARAAGVPAAAAEPADDTGVRCERCGRVMDDADPTAEIVPDFCAECAAPVSVSADDTAEGTTAHGE